MTSAWRQNPKMPAGLGNSLTVLGLAVLCAWALLACTAPDETTAIRSVIAQGAARAEDHDTQGLLELTTEDFIALPGDHRAPMVRQILRMAFRHYGALRIIYPQPQVNVDPQGASSKATVYFLIVKQDRHYPELQDLYTRPQQWLEAVGENADLYRLQLTLRPTKGTWRVARAHLASFQGIGFQS